MLNGHLDFGFCEEADQVFLTLGLGSLILFFYRDILLLTTSPGDFGT